MPISHLVASGGALLACAGMGFVFIRLGVLGIGRRRLPMRVGEVQGRGAVVLGVVYVVVGVGFLLFGIAIFLTPIR
jgi:hypothetical protein